jgi:hypothetical protein
LLRDEGDGHELGTCGFDANTYHSADRSSVKRAQDTLRMYGAAVLIPRHPLKPGHRYAVEIATMRHTFKWDFSIANGQRSKDQTAGINRQPAARSVY